MTKLDASESWKMVHFSYFNKLKFSISESKMVQIV